MKQGTRWLGLTCLMVLVLVIGVSVASADTLMMPPRDALMGTPVVVWGNTTLANLTAFSMDCENDGTPEVSGNVADQSYIATTCTYGTAGTKTAKLTVGSESATTTVTVHDSSQLSAFNLRGVQINLAIQDGLRWLYVNQDNRTSTFPNSPTASWSGSFFPAAHTSMVVLAFENHGYQLSNDNNPPTGIYQKHVVQKGLNFIFDSLSQITLDMQPGGDPCVGVADAPAPCTGLGLTDFHSGYETPVATLAIAGSGAPNRTVASGLGANNSGYVAGKTHAEILQRLSNTVVWGQADSGLGRGGWYYHLQAATAPFGNSGLADGSTMGWGVLALLDAAAAGATVPNFAKTEMLNNVLVNALNTDGHLDYQVDGDPNSASFASRNVAKTGIALQALFFTGVAQGDSRVQNAKTFIGNRWPGTALAGDWGGTCGWPAGLGDGAGTPLQNKGCAYAMFNVFKGFKLYGINTLAGVNRLAGPGSIPADDWHADYQDYLVANQQSPNTTGGGAWFNPQMWFSCCSNQSTGITALAELILAPVALVLPSDLMLAPPTATNPVGTTHTVTATATTSGGAPVPGATVTFTVTAGPNVGTTGTGVTDSNGQATFTYTSNGSPGTDTIQASIGNLQSNTVEKIWVQEPTPGAEGRMTGGGSVFTASGMRVTHGFELHCDATKSPNRLEINWGKGNRFHLESLTSASCSDDPSIAPNPPAAGFDTYKGEGTGRYNGQPGATVKFKLTDAGEPGKNDTAEIEVKVGSTTVLSVSGKLNSGNQQAHKD